MTDFSVQGRRVVVIGAARSGVAAAELLARRGAHVVLTDTRDSIENAGALRDRGIRLELGGHRQSTLTSADMIVFSPGVSPWQPTFDAPRRAGIPMIGELELASRWMRGRLVAITGTKGKSTTTTLVGEMLRAGGHRTFVGGNLGTAASLQVDGTGPDVVHVLEASSFQLEMTDTFHPDVAVLLNFSPDHLDRHRSVDEYGAAKARVFANQDAQDLAVINADDPEALRLARGARARCRPFSLGAPSAGGVGIAEGVIVRDFDGNRRPLVPVASVRLLGRHLLGDVVAAAAVADEFGVDRESITRAVEAFTGLEHAIEPVATVGHVRFVNDSKATNVDAARQAIEAFDRDLVPIMGGRFKGGDLGLLAGPLRARARAVVLIGESRPRFREALESSVKVVEAESMRDAVRSAWELARPDGIVLLAPACASFDMFRDYAERGRSFKSEVGRLVQEVGAPEQ